MRPRTLIVVLVVLILAACTGEQGEDPSDWSTFLAWVTTPGGGSLVIGVLMSAGYEYVPGLEQLTAKWKRLVFLGCCLAVPVAVAVLGVATDGWPASWQATFWPAIVSGFVTFGSGTITHTPRLPDAPGLE